MHRFSHIRQCGACAAVRPSFREPDTMSVRLRGGVQMWSFLSVQWYLDGADGLIASGAIVQICSIASRPHLIRVYLNRAPYPTFLIPSLSVHFMLLRTHVSHTASTIPSPVDLRKPMYAIHTLQRMIVRTTHLSHASTTPGDGISTLGACWLVSYQRTRYWLAQVEGGSFSLAPAADEHGK